MPSVCQTSTPEHQVIDATDMPALNAHNASSAMVANASLNVEASNNAIVGIFKHT